MYIDPTGHWIKGDMYLNDDAKAEIIALTAAWYAAKTPKEKEKISRKAEAIRNINSNYTWIRKDTLVNIKM